MKLQKKEWAIEFEWMLYHHNTESIFYGCYACRRERHGPVAILFLILMQTIWLFKFITSFLDAFNLMSFDGLCRDHYSFNFHFSFCRFILTKDEGHLLNNQWCWKITSFYEKLRFLLKHKFISMYTLHMLQRNCCITAHTQLHVHE